MKKCKYCKKKLENKQIGGHQPNCKLNPNKNKNYRNFKNYPKWVVDIFNKEKINIEDAILISEAKIKTKKMFQGICEICKKKFTLSIQRLGNRQWKKEICGKCYVPKFVTQQPEWKNNQKNAQLIAQNKSETLLKNSNSVKKFWKEHPEIKISMGVKISKLHQNEEYRKKVHGSIYKGHIETKWGSIRFESLLELNYIINAINDPYIYNLKRWNKKGIKYISILDNNEHKYYPDFIINNERILEIKSNFIIDKHRDNLNAKEEATKKQYPNLRFSMLSEDSIKPFYNSKINSLLNLIQNYNIKFYNVKVKEKINNSLSR